MDYLLKVWSQTADIIVLLCDVLATANIKEDERSYFMSAKIMVTMHLLADLENVFTKYYLRKLDVIEGLIIDAFLVSLW